MEALQFETYHTTEAQSAQRECGGLLYVAGTGGEGSTSDGRNGR